MSRMKEAQQNEEQLRRLAINSMADDLLARWDMHARHGRHPFTNEQKLLVLAWAIEHMSMSPGDVRQFLYRFGYEHVMMSSGWAFKAIEK